VALEPLLYLYLMMNSFKTIGHLLDSLVD
jgi:hypothetical protein